MNTERLQKSQIDLNIAVKNWYENGYIRGVLEMEIAEAYAIFMDACRELGEAGFDSAGVRIPTIKEESE